jgi:hypothetical protein
MVNWKRIEEYLFEDVSLMKNISALAYAGMFFVIVYFVMIGIFEKLYSGYFEVVVLAFIAVVSLRYWDRYVSNGQGIYQISLIVFAIGCMLGLLLRDVSYILMGLRVFLLSLWIHLAYLIYKLYVSSDTKRKGRASVRKHNKSFIHKTERGN